MNLVLNTLTRAIRAYPHGIVGIAEDIRRDKEVLRKELGPGQNHKLGVMEAIAIAAHCCQAGTEHCYDFAVYVAEECGGKFVVGEAAAQEPQNPVQKIGCLVRETSDVTQVVLDSMADGTVSDNELMVIEAEVAQAEEVLRKLRQAARAVNAAGKPRALVDLPVRSMTPEAA